jgi:hypothetical protein
VQKSQNRKAKEIVEQKRRHAEWEKEQAEHKINEAKETLQRLKKAEKEAEQRRLERKK